MAKSPSTTGSSGRGRDERGRFVKGNPGGGGNPLGGQVARLRAALLAAVMPGDIARIIATLVKKAERGDIAAAKVVLAYTIGKPIEHDVFERLEVLEGLADEIESSKEVQPWRGRHGQHE